MSDSRQSGRTAKQFTHSARLRWSLIPTTGFLAFMLAIVWLRPEWLGDTYTEGPTRTAALTVGGAILIVLLGAIFHRLRVFPASVAVERDSLIVHPFVGRPRGIAWSDVTRVEERVGSFLRPSGMLRLQVTRRRHVVISRDIEDYDQLRRLLKARLPRSIDQSWQRTTNP